MMERVSYGKSTKTAINLQREMVEYALHLPLHECKEIKHKLAFIQVLRVQDMLTKHKIKFHPKFVQC